MEGYAPVSNKLCNLNDIQFLRFHCLKNLICNFKLVKCSRKKHIPF